MKLLKKSTINVELAQQRKQQIDEGLLIARKVDALRQTLADLEKQQQLFIAGMESELKQRTQKLIDTIAYLTKQLEILEAKRMKLLEPLTHQWAELRQAQAHYNIERDQLSKEILRVSTKEKKLIEIGRELKERNRRSKVRERELDRTLEKANGIKQKAETLLAQTKNQRKLLKSKLVESVT